MRKVIFESSISLDGYIEGPNGELDWLVFEEGAHSGSRFLSFFDTIFYGRKAYEKMAIPHAIDRSLAEEERQMMYAIHGMRKYVFSKTHKHVAGNAMVVSENLEAEVHRIREEDGKNIWFCGGADIMRTFASFDLIDEYLLTVHPVVLHSGTPLFPGAKMPLDLNLVNKRRLRSGVVVLQYLPASRLK